MKAIRNLLVVVDPTTEEQPAFEAGLAIAATSGARLDLFACEHRDAHVRYHPVELTVAQQFHDLILENLTRRLDRLAGIARERGVETRQTVAWAVPLYEEIIAKARELGADLVVKGTQYHSKIRRTLFTGADWHLIRDCPVPLLLVKDAHWPAQPVIVAAVDPLHAHDKPAALDRQLLETAVLFKTLLDGRIEALHVYAMPGPLEVIGDAAAVATSAATLPHAPSLDDVREALASLLEPYGIASENQHVRVGRPAEGIVDFATEQSAAFVVMGALSRSRLERLFVGSTAEAVLDHLPCNVLVEKPGRR
ncbi:MAG TPA: universal stress protein [Steroidobacteraceae bacterium]|nr:universal stress protein [Steroidobacteraceae bacterium]